MVSDSQTQRLDKISPGQGGVVSRVSGDGPVFRRLLDMGLTSGAPVTVTKVAPLGDPIELTVRGYQLSIRKSEASNVEVEVLPCSSRCTRRERRQRRRAQGGAC